MSFPGLGRSLHIPETLKGVDEHLLPEILIPPTYNLTDHRLTGAHTNKKVSALPGNPAVVLRWSNYPLDGKGLRADPLQLLEEAGRQWQRFDESGLPVVAHRNIHIGVNTQTFLSKEGKIITAAERLTNPHNLNPITNPSDIAPAITAVAGLVRYAHKTLDTPGSLTATDIFKFHQMSVIEPGTSVRAIVGDVVIHDIGHEYMPTFEPNGTLSLAVGIAISNARSMAGTALNAAYGGPHEDAARATYAEANVLYQSVKS